MKMIIVNTLRDYIKSRTDGLSETEGPVFRRVSWLYKESKANTEHY